MWWVERGGSDILLLSGQKQCTAYTGYLFWDETRWRRLTLDCRWYDAMHGMELAMQNYFWVDTIRSSLKIILFSNDQSSISNICFPLQQMLGAGSTDPAAPLRDRGLRKMGMDPTSEFDRIILRAWPGIVWFQNISHKRLCLLLVWPPTYCTFTSPDICL